jgi:3-dehydroquinate synthase
LVLIDPEVLNSLPPRQLSAGFAEVVKYGLIDDAAFFSWCEENLDDFFAGEPAAREYAREYAIVHSVTAKARIVAADERETTGIRALLNLGHTFGHALEAETGFSDRLLHGEAVAAGMVLAFRYSARLGHCSDDAADRVSRLLARANLPVSLREAGALAPGEVLAGHMLHDKKMSGGTLPFLLARAIGETFLSKDVDLGDVMGFLDDETDR